MLEKPEGLNGNGHRSPAYATRPLPLLKKLEPGVGVGEGELDATPESVKLAVWPVGSAGRAEKSKLLDVPGGLGELSAATADEPGTCPVSVMEEKIPGVVTEMLTELMVMVLPLLLVTVNDPALEILVPAPTLIDTEFVTFTLICALATPAIPIRQQPTTPSKQSPV
jgi:hypothetical protein